MASGLVELKRLESLRFEFGVEAAAEKVQRLQSLKSSTLKTAEQIVRLHEILCFIQAWPDDDAVLLLTEAILDRFERRRDVKQHAEKLSDTGIAGAEIHFRFYFATALWLAERCPNQLQIDWEEFEDTAMLESYFDLLATYSETPGLDAVSMDLEDWIDRLKGPHETDAVFVLKRLATRVADSFLSQRLYEEIDTPLVLSPGPTSPTRTRAKYDRSPIVYQTTPLNRVRPTMADEIGRAPQPPKLLSRAEGSRLVDLAHSAMVTRHRDLDAFAYADPNDVSLVDDGDLQFVLHGVLPARRFLLETLYGYLVLKNGVPISYGSITSMFNSAEVAYTIFDTFRGGDSARTYVRALVLTHHIFGCDTFMIDPYQLGEDNDDALQSGAWWFYQKLGYRPREKRLLRLMQSELSKMKRRPRHRSSIPVLKQLATENVYLSLRSQRDDVLGLLELPNVGLKITDMLAERFGCNREQGEQELAAEAAQQRLGVTDFRGWSADEKLAWRRWGPLVALLDNLDRWSIAERSALAQLIRAKGGRQELEFARQFDNHQRLRKAVAKLAQD